MSAINFGLLIPLSIVSDEGIFILGSPRRGSGEELLPAGGRDGARLPRQGRHTQGHQGEKTFHFNVGTLNFSYPHNV